MSTPCTSTELRADTGSSATATTRELSAMRRWRAKYNTFSELAKLTTGALTIRVDTGCSSTLSRKPAGSCTDRLAPAGSDDANALPTLAIGGTGLIGVTANIAPQPYRAMVDAINDNNLAAATAAHRALEPLVRATMTHVPGTVSAKYVLHGLGRISSPRVRLPLVGPEEWEAALIEDELDLVKDVPGADFSNFRPDRNAAAGGALPKVHGTTR